ncbi:MAG: SsrA-binding protein SmpB [Firmicutes bacterium]|nr:SsrA-binding protein SmpB [Bacillota bacterium]
MALLEIRKIATNRRARHEYFIEETIEAGIVLTGTEVKALRLGKGNLNDSYAQIKAEEVFLYNCHISPYEYGNRFNHDPLRPRKLLLHKAEIRKLAAKIKEKGYTLVPLSMYFDRKNRVKVELALAKGKKLYDKRHDLAKRDAAREMARALKGKPEY